MPSFSRDQAAILITLYEAFPCLYAVNSADYKDKSKRNEALKEIAKHIVQITGVNFSLEEVKKKIHVLRTQFHNEHGKIKKSIASGASADKIYKPQLWCFEHLKFLEEATPRKKGALDVDGVGTRLSVNTGIYYEQPEESEHIFNETLKEIENIDFDISEESCPSSSGAITPKQFRSMKRKKSIEPSDILQQAAAVIESIQNDKEDEYEIFGRFIASELRKVRCPQRLRDCKRLLTNAVYDAQE